MPEVWWTKRLKVSFPKQSLAKWDSNWKILSFTCTRTHFQLFLSTWSCAKIKEKMGNRCGTRKSRGSCSSTSTVVSWGRFPGRQPKAIRGGWGVPIWTSRVYLFFICLRMAPVPIPERIFIYFFPQRFVLTANCAFPSHNWKISI